MHLDNLVALVTFLALATYLWTGIGVGRSRHRYNVPAPATTGAPEFERAFRVQMNTLEWLPVFLVSMWLFAWLWDGRFAAGIGLVWVLARIHYAVSYSDDPSKRAPGFMIQAIATMVLLAGDIGRVIFNLVTGG